MICSSALVFASSTARAPRPAASGFSISAQISLPIVVADFDQRFQARASNSDHVDRSQLDVTATDSGIRGTRSRTVQWIGDEIELVARLLRIVRVAICR